MARKGSDPENARTKAREFGIEIAELAADKEVADSTAHDKLRKLVWSFIEEIGRPTSDQFNERSFLVFRQHKGDSVFTVAKELQSYNRNDPRRVLEESKIEFDDQEVVAVARMAYGEIRRLDICTIERIAFNAHPVRDNTGDDRWEPESES